jgi:hypothetical protein
MLETALFRGYHGEQFTSPIASPVAEVRLINKAKGNSGSDTKFASRL